MKKFKLQDIVAQGESVDLEFKAAQGRDGSGEVPNSVWKTYSAMANTDGGDIYLGISEKSPGVFDILGIKNTGKLIKAFWDTLHGKNKVNKNLLKDSDVAVVNVEDKEVIKICIPRARRQDRPVHLSTNPFGNTYLRRHEGDYKAEDETVKRMLAESLEDSRDDRILENYWIEDLSKETISAYRNRFSAAKPENPWLALSTEEFLIKIGAFGKDRSTGKTGLRAAGLLMFGSFDTIREVFPNYMLDYQERPQAKAEARWIDRLVPDGSWSGNLYDFFQKTYRKLTTDLKTPFQLSAGVRTDDTPVHEALREALTNTLIHADYSGRVSVLVVKRPDMFGFRNPGLMRVTPEQAIYGGNSDCRNRRIQDMFRYVGLGDHAGSGIPKIYKNWKEQHWRSPLLREDKPFEQTLLELRMISLLPKESVELLDHLFGNRFRKLLELERIILVTAATEGMVNHDRMKQISLDHPKDITTAFVNLVQEKMLVKHGETRASYYQLPDSDKNIIENISIFSDTANSPDLLKNSPDLPNNSPDLSALLPEALLSLGYSKMPRKIKKVDMRKLIITLCKNRTSSLKEIGLLLSRNSKSLQEQYLTPMVEEGILELKYPTIKNHPDQGYKSK